MGLLDSKREALDVELSAGAMWELRSPTRVACYRGQLPSYFPVIYDVVSGCIVEVAVIFLYDYFNLASGSSVKNTLQAAAEDLRDWWTYLERFEISWTDATTSQLHGYVKASDSLISPRTGKELSSNTTKRRVSTIRSFYRWASKEPRLFNLNLSSDKLLFPGVAENYRVKHKRPDYEHVPHPLSPKNARGVFDLIGKLPTEVCRQHTGADFSDIDKSANDIVQRCTARLGAQLALDTGMRVAEVAGLPVKAFEQHLRIDSIADSGKYTISINGKGRKTREIELPGILLREILQYIGSIRKYISQKSSVVSRELLLHSPGAGTRWAGRALSTRKLQRSFTTACKNAGIVSTNLVTVIRQGIAAEERLALSSWHTFHDLRHTYAIWTYCIFIRVGGKDPWLFLQKQLGHALKSTTINIYTKLSRAYEAEVSDAYMASLNS